MSESRCGYIALVGLPNAGKSSLLNTLLETKLAPVTQKSQTTRSSICGVLTKDNCQMLFLDTPGLLQADKGISGYMLSQAKKSIRQANILVWISDTPHLLADPVFESSEAEEMKNVLQKIDPEVKVVWVLNKQDKVPKKDKLLPLIEKRKTALKLDNVDFFSSRSLKGNEGLVKTLCLNLPKGEFAYDADCLTSEKERDLVVDLIREQILFSLGDEVPHQVAVTISNFDESRREDKKKPIISIEAVLHVGRDSQKAIVLGKGGAKIKTIGMNSRKTIEQLLGCQVMLKLVVRVEKDWTKDPAKMKKLGFI